MRQQNTRQQSLDGRRHHQSSKACCSDKRRNTPTSPTLWHKDKADTVKPSSWHPGTVPFGLTNSPRRNVRYPNKLQQDVFFYNRRNLPALKKKRTIVRRLRRVFKRTRLRVRAKQVAKQFLRRSSLSKRELTSHPTKQKIKHQCREWFKSTRHVLKAEFRSFCATLKGNRLGPNSFDFGIK